MGGRRRDQGEILADLRTGQTLSVAAASSRSSSPGSASPADVIDERLSRLSKTTPAYARRLQIVCRLRGGPQGRMGLRRPPGAAGPGRPYGPCRGPSGPGGLLGLQIFEAAGADISDPGKEHAPAWPPVRSRSGWRTGGQLSSLSDQRNHVLGILGLPDLDG